MRICFSAFGLVVCGWHQMCNYEPLNDKKAVTLSYSNDATLDCVYVEYPMQCPQKYISKLLNLKSSHNNRIKV